MLGHGLLMQGLTILQELTTSWCEEACAWEAANPDNAARSAYVERRTWGKYKKKCKESRRGFGELLRVRLTVADDDWRPASDFDPSGELVRGIVTPPFDWFFRAGRDQGAFAFMVELGKLRNAFNHA